MDKTGAIEQFERDGKTYVRVNDYPKMREGVGHAAGRADADQGGRGLRRHQGARGQIRRRSIRSCATRWSRAIQALNLPTYWAGINPALTATLDAAGAATAVGLSLTRDAVGQYLSYGRMYDPALPEPR